ncbi:AAA family ATPase [Marisediminicola senii]|uniref:AAA family ATPase n=1 Tax=Marisediminicola senii TaxID=2711233 RepID=UPI0013EBC9F6|nr:regulator [Marisediminicola senii]
MAVVVLAVPADLLTRLDRHLRNHGHEVGEACSSADELIAVMTSSGCDAALVSADPRFLTAAVLSAADAAGVRVIGIIASDGQRRHAASIGLLETVQGDGDWTVVEPMIEALIAGVGTDAAVPAGRGRVIAVWGPAGAPGRTSLAISIAAEIAAAGYSVALCDVDTYSGSVAPALGLLDEAPGFAAACRLAGAGGLTLHELERIGQRYRSGHGSFWVLTGIGRPNRWPELSSDRVTATLATCREWVDYTVVDTGFSLETDEEISSDLFAPRRNAATLAALREADDVVAVGAADPVGLSRFLRVHSDLLEAATTDRVTVVMNRVRQSAIGLSPASQVRGALQRFGGISTPVIVPHDQSAFDAAVLAGTTVRDAATRSAARVAIGELVASRLLPQVPQTMRTRRALRNGTRSAGARGGTRGGAATGWWGSARRGEAQGQARPAPALHRSAALHRDLG